MNPVQLHVWPGNKVLPSISPYCLKLVYGMKYKKIGYDLKVAKMGAPKIATWGMLPVAEIAGRVVQDSTHILRAIDKMGDASKPFYPADPLLRAETILLESWSDEWFAPLFIFLRWGLDPNFDRFSARNFARMPMLIRKLLLPQFRKATVKLMEARSIGLYSEQERDTQLDEHFWLLDQKLSQHRFLVTETPTAADFAVYPYFKLAEDDEMPEFLKRLSKYPRISQWVEAMDQAVH